MEGGLAHKLHTTCCPTTSIFTIGWWAAETTKDKSIIPDIHGELDKVLTKIQKKDEEDWAKANFFFHSYPTAKAVRY